jgi:hypothetical protein
VLLRARMLVQTVIHCSKGVTITPSRLQLLNQWARSGLPASLALLHNGASRVLTRT